MKRISILGHIVGLSLLLSMSNAQDSTLVLDTLDLVDTLVLDSAQQKTELQFTQALVIQSDEDETMRWVSISPGSVSADSILHYPIFVADANEGSFSLQIVGLDTAAYLGNRMLRDSGHFPIHYQVDLLDSLVIQISGKTLPYDDVHYYYSFDRDEYRLEFIFEDQEVKIGTHLQAPNHVEMAVETTPAKLNYNIIAGKTSDFKKMLLNSVYIALAALVLTLILYFMLKSFRKKTSPGLGSAENFADMLDKKAELERPVIEGNTEQNVLTPESKEEKIRNLMDTEKLSYDEAALRVQYQTMNQTDG